MASTGSQVFPLVPRRRVVGIPFGRQRSLRRGPGSDVAGSRPYVPGDPVSAIDQFASARLSAARGSDEFVVHERFADEAPRVIVVADRRPAMALYGEPFPWLRKPATLAAAAHAIASSALAARADVGYLDYAGTRGRAGTPFWLTPSARGRLRAIDDREAGFDAPEDTLDRALDFLHRRRAAIPSGSFVFVLSDFLAPMRLESWRRAVVGRWDVVPVVIQDPVWESSFPELGPLVVPVADPADGGVSLVRISAREARARREGHEGRRRELLARLGRLGLDPVVVGSSDPALVLRAFLAWAERRRRARMALR